MQNIDQNKEMLKILNNEKQKVDDRFRITDYKNIFSKGYTGKWSKEIFFTNSVLKTNPWLIKGKNIRKKI